MAEEATTLSELEVLVELQELDTRLSQLTHRAATLPEREELIRIQEQDSKLQQDLNQLAGQLTVLRKSQSDREAEIQHLEDKVAKATSSLYGGERTSPKEATALQSEIDSLAGRQSLLEDQIIEIMEEIEPFAKEESRIEATRTELRTQIADLEHRISAQVTEIDSEQQSVIAERSEVEDRAGSRLSALYAENRKRMGDHTAIGRLVGTSCGACFLEIAAVEIDRIRRLPDDEPSECPECGALLVR